jgi:hypothetical protein
MCWSGEASAVLATSGFATASYLARKGEPADLWVPLTYFACMELLQAATYIYIDQCDAPQNQVLTWLGYIHIAFQPFFVNRVALHFVPEPVRRRIRSAVYGLCGLGALAILLKLYPFSWARLCVKGYESYCGPLACSTSGDWHIAWQLPLNGLMSHYPDSLLPLFPFGLHAFAYFGVGFLLPFLYGSWRFVGFHLLVGPILANILTRDPNEHAAVWCLLSIGLCVSVVKTPLRRWLRVERWPGYGWCLAAEAPALPAQDDSHLRRRHSPHQPTSQGAPEHRWHRLWAGRSQRKRSE